MKASRKKIIIGSLILLYIIVGFLREFLFQNINQQSYVTYAHPAVSHVSPSMTWLGNYSYMTLYYAKYPLTLFFAIFFAFLSAKIIKITFNDKNLVKITWIAFGVVFVVGLLFFLAGSLTGNSETTYDIARFLAGLTETPVLLIILLASFLVSRRK